MGLPADQELHVRMTGCPNGCARPYMAELGFVGDGPNSYQLYFGGNVNQTRLAQLFADRCGGWGGRRGRRRGLGGEGSGGGGGRAGRLCGGAGVLSSREVVWLPAAARGSGGAADFPGWRGAAFRTREAGSRRCTRPGGGRASRKVVPLDHISLAPCTPPPCLRLHFFIDNQCNSPSPSHHTHRVKVKDLESTLEPIFAAWKASRRPKESFGDWVSRVGFAAVKTQAAAAAATLPAPAPVAAPAAAAGNGNGNGNGAAAAAAGKQLATK